MAESRLIDDKEYDSLRGIESRLDTILNQAEGDASVPEQYLRALRFIKTGENL